MIPTDERLHLDTGPRRGEQPGGAGLVDVAARCGGNAHTVLARVREVLGTVIDHQLNVWPELSSWRVLLPVWFVNTCAEETSREEAEVWLTWWRSLPHDLQAAELDRRPWSLADWLFWLQPEERHWYWWDASVETPSQLCVTVQVESWPAPLDALKWLLRAAGAESAEIRHV